MRPLVVLLLVLAAGIALFLTLNKSPEAPTVEPVIVAPPEPTPAKAPVEDVQAPVADNRVATEDVPASGPGVNAVSGEVAGNNSLYGLVTNEQKQPLSGAKVELCRDPRMGQEVVMAWIAPEQKSLDVPLVTTTDANGKYRFTRVIPRPDYYLIVSHAEYAPVQEKLVAVGEQGEFAGPNVVLKSGSIIEGLVLDEAGNTVPDAELWLDSAFYNGEGTSPDRLITRSDAMGHFEFKNVYPVSKQATCKAEGYGSQTINPVNVKGEPGERISLEFKLVIGQPIGGKVVGSDGNPVKDAKVVAYNTSNNRSFRGETVSLEDGSFTLLNLHPGQYILTCEAKGYRQQKHTRVAVGNMAVVIDMVAQACIQGRVVDSAGAPVTTFTASVRRLPAPNQVAPNVNAASEETGVKETFTNAPEGAFQLCGLDPGQYVVLAGSPTSAPTFSDPFVISANSPSADVTVRLSKGGSIKGIVVSSTGTPIGGVSIETRDDAVDDVDDMFSSLIPSNATKQKVVSAADGSFELRFLTPENYQIRLTHPSYAQGKKREIKVTDGPANDVGTIQMQVGGTVKGTVINEGGGPLAGAFVHLESEWSDLVLDTRSDAKGNYSIPHVRPGNYTLSATADTSGDADAFQKISQVRRTNKKITVTEGSEATYELSLSGG